MPVRNTIYVRWLRGVTLKSVNPVHLYANQAFCIYLSSTINQCFKLWCHKILFSKLRKSLFKLCLRKNCSNNCPLKTKFLPENISRYKISQVEEIKWIRSRKCKRKPLNKFCGKYETLTQHYVSSHCSAILFSPVSIELGTCLPPKLLV